MKRGFNIIEVMVCVVIIGLSASMFQCAKDSTRYRTSHYTIASYYDSDKMECASRDFKVGTLLRVTHNGKSILVPVTSAGPSKEMYAKGRHLDLSKLAFSQLDNPDVGLIEVTVEER